MNSAVAIENSCSFENPFFWKIEKAAKASATASRDNVAVC